MEMWDDAAEVARTMKEGEYYHIKNARMRANRAGYLEGKVTQSKIVKLEETDAEMNIHLRSLLEFVIIISYSSPTTDGCFTGGRKFGQLTNWPKEIQKLNFKFFHCTVEVRNISCDVHFGLLICL